MLDDPLHDTEVVHHLHKGNEEDDGSQDTGEEPVLGDDGILIEEEDGTDFGLLQEVSGEEGEPLEDLEPSTGLEDKEGDGLLEEKSDDDRLPGKEAGPDQTLSHNVVGVIRTADRKTTHHGT